MRLLLFLPLLACAHTPETTLHLAAPAHGAWTARDVAGAPLCTLPCTIPLETKDSIIVARAGGPEFVVQQQSLGAGIFSGFVREQREPSAGARALEALSGVLVGAGTTMVQRSAHDRPAAGIILASIGTLGMLASDALPKKSHEELWLQRVGDH